MVSFPTAEVLAELKDLDKATDGVLLLANPQWSTEGQVISDLGFGPWKQRNEEFIAKFDKTYLLQRRRIKGEQLELLKAYPYPEWQAFVVPQDGSKPEVFCKSAERPTYWELEEILSNREGSIASKDWLTRAQSEAKFNADSLKGQ
eukprot:gnl/TRDRNA2_/TRDRNA2_162182_c1_seq3.p1 gnl/TRDRNA2_/TRDRNA2_162182_c1~~gnl/TRDRNA2_/TRDRNA2_162182_c1_seq3.p1  ORF type:complete len:158 (-),score=39.04 gnl/TRDRNA2_/TRDRNA2_162182_c1_seq3:332-769(-)